MTNHYAVYTIADGTQVRFQWDEEKEWANRIKHGLRFETVLGLWEDPLAEEFFDENYDGELRFIRRGFNELGMFVVVVFTEKSIGTLRIISARLGTLRERKRYER